MERGGARLFTVELALGARPFELTSACDPMALQLRTRQQVWHKESMLRLGIERLPADAKYIAWIDADVEFVRHDFVEEIVHKLQEYDLVQCFRSAIDLGPSGEHIGTNEGFVWSWQNRSGMPALSKYYTSSWHSGYAWAARMDAYDKLGGLMDGAVLGSADRHMACCLIGKGMASVPSGLTPGYKRMVQTWQDRCTAANLHLGCVDGTLVHHFHGAKKLRQYGSRWKILERNRFDPYVDLQYDHQGLIGLSARGMRMREDLVRYFRERSEDDTSL